VAEHATTEARIALDNLRTSARAFADAVADARAPEGTELRAETALLRRADVPTVDGDTMKALAAVTQAASDLLRQARAFVAEQPRLLLSARRLEADLAIAAGVLRTIDRSASDRSASAVPRVAPEVDETMPKVES
jgi:hypothetical protein